MGTHNPQTCRFFLMTIDPVHIGTGGARLGRVDNPIVREPGTNLPKIPGSSLHGMIRHYAAHRYGKPQCAGQGQARGGRAGHCGQPTCPICYTFGSVTGEGAYAGVVAISDAHILLFPVYSMVGPVWVTSPAALEAAGFEKHEVAPDKAQWDSENQELPADKHINLGWLMVERDGDLPKLNFPKEIPKQIRKRMVLVPDKLFSQIVNSNLEVRTSVSINPETGAAEEGALFTYEAIPRATVLWMDVVVRDYRGAFPNKSRWEQICSNMGSGMPSEMPDSEIEIERTLHALGYIGERPQRQNQESDDQFEQRKRKYWESVKKAWEDCQHVLENLKWSTPCDVVVLGLEWAEHLGVGGMGTRGFGRIRDLVCCPVEDDGTLGGSCKNDEGNARGGTENTEE